MKTSIIPIAPTFYNIEESNDWDLKAICVFVATGFFLDRDSYFKNRRVMPPASKYTLNENGFLEKETSYFKWHYSPRRIRFEQALEEYIELFETIIHEQVGNKKVVLPISGGLDSRTQAVALHHLNKNVVAYSYEFEGGYPETRIAKKIAQIAGFPFTPYTIPKGYLWNAVEELATINGGYSDFTHPRQMAIKEHLGRLGEIFSLGHWGDVLFDRGVGKGVSETDFPNYLKNRILKKGGTELAQQLWKSWGLEGTFEEYISQRLCELWESVTIDNLSARMRAFKSLYWAPRWTSTNLSVFSAEKPISLPYYDDRMCEFICTVPEEYLADRKLQIAYIKQRSPKMARVTWQGHKPFNLYTFHRNTPPYNVPHRIKGKLLRETQGFFGKKYVQRNWELQFLGQDNQAHLKKYLYDTSFLEWVPREVIDVFLHRFLQRDSILYSHPLSMLLTLSVKHKLVSHAT